MIMWPIFLTLDPAYQILSVNPAYQILTSWVEEANGLTTCLVVAEGLSAPRGVGDGRGICLVDGKMEAPGVPVESGCSDMLLQCVLA